MTVRPNDLEPIKDMLEKAFREACWGKAWAGYWRGCAAVDKDGNITPIEDYDGGHFEVQGCIDADKLAATVLEFFARAEAAKPRMAAILDAELLTQQGVDVDAIMALLGHPRVKGDDQ